MSKLSLPTISMEAINYQGRSLLLFDLVSAVEILRSSSIINQDALDSSGLSAVIFKRTGIRVQLLLNKGEHDYDNFVEPPVVDAANPYFILLNSYGLAKAGISILERHQRALRLASETMGLVDLKHGRVGGVFSTLTNRMFLSQAMLRDQHFTSEEVAAIILHEIGHLFSYFETVAHSSASNSVISTAIDALRGLDDRSIKIKLVSNSLNVFGHEDDDTVEVIADVDDDVTLRIVLLKTIEEAAQTRMRVLSQERSVSVNTRSIEHMADQYAIRNGASLQLAVAQHKLGKHYAINDYDRRQAVFLAFQATRYTSLIALTLLIPPVGATITVMLALLLCTDAYSADYRTDPSTRIARIKVDLVQLLKNTKLDSKLRKQILDDIEAIDALREDAKEHEGVVRYLWRTIIPTGRHQAKIREFQKGLEDLVNNDLFVQAQRLRSL
jgi:hypothetical protein